MQTEREQFAPSAAPAMAQTPAHAPEVSPFANWAFEHKAAFSKQSPLAWYGIRNVMSNMAGICGLMATIVPVRMAMGHGAKWAEAKGWNILSEELSRPMWQNSVGVGVSFGTFRTIYKTCQRNYDDLFVRPTTKQETQQAWQDLPHKTWENIKQIAPVEYPVTMAGAFALVGIRSAIVGQMPAETLAKKKFGEIIRDKNVVRDMIGCGFFAYPAFFEITDRFGRAGQLQRGYSDPYHNESIGRDKVGVSEYIKRQVPGIAAGILPYIAFNTWGIHNVGRQNSYNTLQRAAGNTKIDGYLSGVWQERPYQFFWMFSLGRDVYFDIYDKLTGKGATPGQHAAHAPKAEPDTVVTDAQTPTPLVTQRMERRA